MRNIFPVAFVFTLIFSGGYLYYTKTATCITPLHYRLGTVDPRFNFSEKDAKEALDQSVSIWEEATGRDLFTYDEKSKFVVDFIYDNRQHRVITESIIRSNLDKKEKTSTQIATQYKELNAEYRKLRSTYETRVSDYNTRLKRFNETVAKYNSEGGAPDSVFADLQKEEKDLIAEAEVVSSLSDQLSKVVAILNTLGKQGNQIIQQYNVGVQSYNSEFGEADEFTQGDYQGDKIDIYKFSDSTELQKVLLHEFGHALGIGHVEGNTSIMYYLMESQPDTLTLTTEDLDAFIAVCGDGTGIKGWTKNVINRIYNLINS